MANIIKIKRAPVTGSTAPSTLSEGELAYSENSKKLFIGTNGGVDVQTIGGKADHDKLSLIESGATADQTAAEILTAIKTVDGAGSGLDADLFDGLGSGSFALAHTHPYLSSTHDASGVTATKISKWDATSSWHALMDASDDADNIVNTVAEMITLFDSTAESLDLMTALNAKMDDGQTIDGGTF